MGKKRIIVLGAGLAGLSAAWHLQKKGIDCQVFEKESEVGGLCRSKKIDGFTFDYSGHLLHFKHDYAFNLIKNLLGNNLVKHKRSAWIYSAGVYTPYPFQANLHGLPANIAKECLLGFIDAIKNHKVKDKKELTFLDWINYTFGSGIARYFMIPYNTKFWTVAPEELTCEWLDDFIPVPSLREVIEGTIEESRRQFGYNAHFWYPKKGGISEVARALSGQIKHIYTDCEVTEIDLKAKEIRLNSANREKFDYLISALPLPEFPRLVKDLPSQISPWFKKLRWNSILNFNLGIEKKDCSGKHWAYFPQEGLSFFRIGFAHNFSTFLAPEGRSSLYVEVSYSQEKLLDKKNVVARIMQELKKVGILNQNDKICVSDLNDIKYGYPIYDKNHNSARETVIKYLRQNNIIPCGRYGSWRYMSMEGSILDGRDALNYFR
ncbi:MAG: FAD-dependent oxidoreductase [Candidatus Omnitrophota bacterium]